MKKKKTYIKSVSESLNNFRLLPGSNINEFCANSPKAGAAAASAAVSAAAAAADVVGGKRQLFLTPKLYGSKINNWKIAGANRQLKFKFII